jgi:hypothetical protein
MPIDINVTLIKSSKALHLIIIDCKINRPSKIFVFETKYHKHIVIQHVRSRSLTRNKQATRSK